MVPREVVVVGAGIAGLTAAYRLKQAGHHVQVLEASPNAGGRMITIEWNGLSIDPGAEFVTVRPLSAGDRKRTGCRG